MIYKGEKTKEISFPLGGIGSGSIGIAGNGSFMDWEIFNKPDKGSTNGYTHIAVKAEDINNSLVSAKILNCDMDKEYLGRYSTSGGFGFGMLKQTMAGFPHFKDGVFKGEFPIMELTLKDKSFPAKAKLTAFNPFIPLNEDDSSIPGAFFEVELKNDTDKPIYYTVCFSVKNPYIKGINKYMPYSKAEMIFMKNTDKPKEDIEYGDLCVSLVKQKDAETSYQTNWFRGGWQDSIETFWNDFTKNTILPKREYSDAGKYDTCSVCIRKLVESKKNMKTRLLLTWNVPNNYNYWNPYMKDDKHVTWKNYYATLFKDSCASAKYSIKNWNRLYKSTDLFRKAIFSSTYPDFVKDAISSTLSVLKSPTVLRLENGEFYGWEGVDEKQGSCSGTCTHVWNYAYALPFLFPKLERSIRDTDYKYNMDEDGRMQFRMNLPLGRDRHQWRACVDGQMGGVIKTYRDWKISGDTKWLEGNWESVKKAIAYAWSDKNEDGWDRNKDGVLEGRQHHTLDMELFGPSAWLEGYYLGALKAASEMAFALGEREQAWEYEKLYMSGRGWSFDNLYNGEYFIQKINLKDKNLLEKYDAVDRYWNEDKQQIKYQIGLGCDIDQLCAQWHANICGLGEIFNNKRTKKALKAMYKYNFKKSMRDVVNPWRIYAVNDESGAVICDYPAHVEKPALPVPYNTECMHGFEYMFAGLLISEGLIEEGLSIVKSVRDRYDGRKRNPWNEVECGSNYARSMAAYALVPILSGMTFDMTTYTLGFDPKTSKEASASREVMTSLGTFKSIFSLDCAWGMVSFSNGCMEYDIYAGQLTIQNMPLPKDMAKSLKVFIDGEEIKSFSVSSNKVVLEKPLVVNKRLRIIPQI
ncbi:MAG TPA: GH116 family glycosyl-hydrolase [Clostridia bacterium]|nr:GH116 family glycosyl-hydrolase [Clostridia bacterium]